MLITRPRLYNESVFFPSRSLATSGPAPQLRDGFFISAGRDETRSLRRVWTAGEGQEKGSRAGLLVMHISSAREAGPPNHLTPPTLM